MRRRNRFLLVVALAVIASVAGLYSAPGTIPAQAANSPSASFTTFSISPTTLTADGVSTSTATLHVADNVGAAIPNAGATITVPSGCVFNGNAITGTGSSTTNSISGTADGSGNFVAAFLCHASANTTNAPITTDQVFWAATSNSVTISNSVPLTVNPPPANAGKSTISANPTSVTADGTSTSTITVTVENAAGDTISNRSISLTASSPPAGLTISGSPQTTSPSGVVTFTVKSSTAASVTFNAIDSLNSATFQTTTVTFTAAGISQTNSSLAISPGSIPADNSTTATVTATVRDSANPSNLVSGATVNLNITSAANSGAVTITGNPATTNGSGVATWTVKCGNLQAQTVTLTANASPSGTQIGNPVTLNCFTPSASAANSTATASPTSVTADNTPSTITVTLKDGSPSANLLPGKTVSVSAANAYPITYPSGNTAVTNASGVATIAVESTTQGTASFVITDTTDNVTLSTVPTVTFTAPIASAANSSITVTGSPAPSDNQTQITITVALRDKANNPILGGKTVTLSPSPILGVTVSPALSQTTNATTGVASFTVKSSVPTTWSFSVTDTTDSVPIGNGSAVFSQAPANALLSTVVASPSSVPADNSTTTTITVHLKDNGGNDVNGLNVALAATANGTGVTISAPSGPSAGGIVTFTAKSTTIHQNPSPTTFTATVTQPDNTQTQINQTAQVQFTSAPAANAVVSVDTTTAQASGCSTKTTGGTGCVTVTIVATDLGGQPAVGKTFSFTPTSCSSGGCTGLSSTPTGLAPATDATGTAKVIIGDTNVETVAFTIADATDPSQPAFNPSNTINLSFTSSLGPVDGSKSTISATPANVPADGSSPATVTATLKDSNGTPVQGATGNLFGTPSNGLTITGGGASSANGIITWTVTSTVPNSVTFNCGCGTAFVGPSNAVNFQPASVIDPTKSTIAANPGTTNAGQNIVITVTLLKSDGSPVPAGQTVNLTFPSGVNFVSPSTNPQSSDVNGQVTYTITGNQGTYSIGATAGNPAVTLQPINVTFNNPACSNIDANASTVTVANSAPADNSTTITVNVHIAGTGGPNAANVTLVTSRGASDTVVAPNPTTADASGNATFQFKSGTPGTGTVSVTATSSNCALNAHPTYTFSSTASPVDPSKSTVVVSPASQTTGGTITVSVTLKDINGNAVTTGKTVTISTNAAGPTITGNPQTSNGSGVATFTITDATAYSGTVIAVGDGVTINQQPTISFTGPAGTASPANSSTSASPNPATVGQTVAITVTVHDSTNAALANKVVTLSASPAGSTITTVSGTTNASGQATFNMTSATAQAYTVTATVTTDNVTLTPITVTFNSVAVGPATTANSTIQASGNPPADGVTPATVTVTLHDASNNPTPNKSVTLNASPNSGLGGSMTGTTNSSGVVTFAITSTVAQSVTFTATDTTDGITISNGSGGATVTYTAVNPSALSPTLSTATANPTSVPADGTTNSTISVNIKNGAGANMPGVFVSIFGTPGGTVAADATQKTTDANGNTFFLVRSSTATTVTFTITATNGSSSITVSQHPVVTFGGSSTTTGGGGLGGTGTNGVSCTNSTISTNYSQIPSNNSTPATITVVLRNTTNGGISGQSVTLTASPATGVTITPASGITDGSGTTTFQVKSSVQGSTVLTVTGAGCTQNLTLLFGSPTSAPIAATAAPGTAGANVLGVPSTGPALGRVVPYRLRVRTGPGLKYHILGLLKQGTIVVLTARNSRGTWFQIQINDPKIPGATAWVSAFYIRVQRLTFRHLPIIDNTLIPPPTNDNNAQSPTNATATPHP